MGITYVARQIEGQVLAGDKVAIGSEHFYVINTDSTTTILFAKYNLLVVDVLDIEYGSNNSPQSYAYNRTLSPSDNGYGLQSSTAKGYDESFNEDIELMCSDCTYRILGEYSFGNFILEDLVQEGEYELAGLSNVSMTNFIDKVYNTSYWNGSAWSSYNALVSFPYNNSYSTDNGGIYSGNGWGVRPVIVIPTSELLN